MTAGTAFDSLSFDDLTEDCPACKGTGIDPHSGPTASGGGSGRKVLGASTSRCGHMRCKGGKVPNALGLVLLRFVDRFGGIELRDF